MKNIRKAAHLLAGSIMTAATVVGSAGLVDARTIAFEEQGDTSSAVVKISMPSPKEQAAAPGFVKFDTIGGESKVSAAAVYLKIPTVPGD